MGTALILGVLTGLTYGLLAVGIVLIYKANRFINVAQAQLGTVSALLLARLVLDDGWSWWAAFPAALAIGVLVAVAVQRLVIRPMLQRHRHPVSLLLVSIGVAQLLLAATYLRWIGPDNTSLYRLGYPLPFDTHINVGAFLLRGQHILVLIVVPTVVALLAAFLRFSAWGKMIRASASNTDAARLCGIPIARVNAITWAIAGGLSAVTAILQAPSSGSLNSVSLGPGLLLRALGAAALGGFTSVPAALAGGLIIGLGEHLTLAGAHNAGTAELVVLLMVIAILVARGRAVAAAAGTSDTQADDEATPARVPAALRSRPTVRYLRPTMAALALVAALLAPVLPFFDSEAHRFELVVTLVMAVSGVALTMLMGWAGQVSLGHFALLGLGAYLAAKMSANNLSLPVSLVLAGLLGAGAMALIGLPALRIRGLAVVVTTLGFAVVAPVWLFHQSWLGASGQSAVVVQPGGFVGVGRLGSQLSIYYAALALLAVTLVAAGRLRRSVAGRLIVAVRDNERALSSFGFVPATVKLTVLALSGAIVTMAGVLWGMSWHTVSVDLVPPEASLVLLAIPVIGGLGSLPGAVAGALLVYLPAFFVTPLLLPLFGSFGKQIGFQLALAGIGLIVVPLAYPRGIAGAATELWERLLRRMADQLADSAAAHTDDRPLVVKGIAKRFGGLTVLDGIDLEIGTGEIVGLIGPNGAGKTTLMNVISGDLTPDSGEVRAFGRELTGLPPYYRAHFGIGRSYQDAALFAGLTTREVIQVALSQRRRVGAISVMAAAPWARRFERRTEQRAEEIVREFGLEQWADTRTAELSTGTRRICELAAQVAAQPKILLLDEPTAGLAQREVEAFSPLIRRVQETLGSSILLIEHDMPLLMSVCDRVYALAAGKVIAEGTPDDIRANQAVVASYLGTSAAGGARSGRRPPAVKRTSRAVPATTTTKPLS